MIVKTEKGWYQVGSIDDGTDEFDAAYWASRSPEEKWSAVWEMAILAHEMKGGKENELELKRPHYVVQPIWD